MSPMPSDIIPISRSMNRFDSVCDGRAEIFQQQTITLLLDIQCKVSVLIADCQVISKQRVASFQRVAELL